MTAKDKVLDNFPDAKIIFGSGWKQESDAYCIVVWEQQTIQQLMRAYSKTESGAWKKAWECIQKQMLETFENS